MSIIDWKNFVEALSFVEKILQNDPSQIYSKMDFVTRDHYRHFIEHFAKKSLCTEWEVASQAIKLAEEAKKRDNRIRTTHGIDGCTG